MTLKTRVLAALTAEYPRVLTHMDLAGRLDALEPSIRRVTAQLEAAGEIVNVGGSMRSLLAWKRVMPAAAAVSSV